MCLAECDPCFTRWFKLGRSHQEALKDEIKPDIPTLQTLLLAGQHRTDIGQKIMDQLSFLIGLWNGASNDEESIGLMIQCGGYAIRPEFNFCKINLPYGETERERLLHVPVLRALMKCVVSAWEPDWSVITSRQYQDKVPLPSSNAPSMGWILYLSNRRGEVPPLPSSTTVERLGKQGTLVITTQERFTASVPDM